MGGWNGRSHSPDMTPQMNIAGPQPNVQFPQTPHDAEHPVDITMDTNAPRGPLTRAQAHATKTKVNSLLSEDPLVTCETWVLPHPDTLCIIKYLDENQEEVVGREEDPQEAEGKDFLQGRM